MEIEKGDIIQIIDPNNPNVIWADGIRIAFGVQVIYIEEL